MNYINHLIEVTLFYSIKPKIENDILYFDLIKENEV
jgi:hypothetical protein